MCVRVSHSVPNGIWYRIVQLKLQNAHPLQLKVFYKNCNGVR